MPARILRSFLKKPGSPNIPIQAIGLSLYETLGTETPEEVPGTKVTRTQWLDLSALEMANLIGKNILIVDEVDDTRTTLEYAVRELQKDVDAATEKLGRTTEKTTFSIFVLHNKDKTKRGTLPHEMVKPDHYVAAVTLPDYWICYPWEAQYVAQLTLLFLAVLWLTALVTGTLTSTTATLPSRPSNNRSSRTIRRMMGENNTAFRVELVKFMNPSFRNLSKT